jgi:hypothetical protein
MLHVSFGNINLWIVRTDLVRCNHRLGVLSGDARHVYWVTGSFAAMAARATSQAASEANTWPVETAVGKPGISIIKTCAISIAFLLSERALERLALDPFNGPRRLGLFLRSRETSRH